MREDRPAVAEIELREVHARDLDLFFAQQLDGEANHMAAFTAKDPGDRAAFDTHWARILVDEEIPILTILADGLVAGSVLSFPMDGRREVSYWIGREFWGRGIATRGLAAYLLLIDERPLFARAAKDNLASLRVLEKCGFAVIGEDRGFANARDEEIEELILRLDAEGRRKRTRNEDQVGDSRR